MSYLHNFEVFKLLRSASQVSVSIAAFPNHGRQLQGTFSMKSLHFDVILVESVVNEGERYSGKYILVGKNLSTVNSVNSFKYYTNALRTIRLSFHSIFQHF